MDLSIQTMLNEAKMFNDLFPTTNIYSESYLSNNIEVLNEYTNNHNNILYSLVSRINEAETVSSENDIFAEYYKMYSELLDSSLRKLREQVSRFNIAIENLVDCNMELVNNVDVDKCSDTRITINKYKNLCNSKYPKFNPLEVYHKEFDILGKTLQDLGVDADNKSKFAVIATVCNNFNTGKNKWLKKTIEDITGKDIDDDITSYSRLVFNLFREGTVEISISPEYLYEAKEAIEDYKKYLNEINAISDKLDMEFQTISENILDMFFRNKNGTLKIETDTVGVKNHTYFFNSSTMNQLNIFMKSKIDQIDRLFRLYVVALSIKMDAILGYIRQSIKVLETSQCCDDNNDNLDFDMDDDDPLIYDDMDEPSEDEVPVEDDQVETEGYLYESSIYFLESMDSEREIFESVLTEAEVANNLKAAVEKNEGTIQKAISWFIMKIKELFNKFKEVVINKNNKRSEFIKNNKEKILKCNIPEGSKLFKCDPDVIKNATLPEFNWNSMKDKLTDEKTFIQSIKHLENYVPDDTDSFGNKFKKAAFDKDTKVDVTKEVLSSAVSYCGDVFSALYKDIQNDINLLDRAKLNTDKLAKSLVAESADDLGFGSYFLEVEMGKDEKKEDSNANQTTNTTGDTKAKDEGDKSKDSGDSNAKGDKSDAKKKLRVYFKVCTNLTSYKMTSAQAIFNEYYTLCKLLLESNGIEVKEPETENKEQQNNK